MYDPKQPVRIQWFSGDLLIENPTELIKKSLFYVHKSLEIPEGGYQRETVKRDVCLYADVAGRPNTIITYQGFVDQAIKICRDTQVMHEVEDYREKIPGPQLRLAKGFRFSQHGMFLRLLHPNRSGFLQAPTRFGKTFVLVNLCRVYPTLRTIIMAPGINLLVQLVNELRAALPGREVKGIFSGSRNRTVSEDITVLSMDSLDKVDPDLVQLILVDEPHALAAPSRILKFATFKKARIYGVGATLDGRFDGADKVLTGLIGPVLVKKTFREAVAEGAICDIKVFMVRVPFQPWKCYDRMQAYKTLIYKNREFFDLVREISMRCIPQEWQTLIFIDQISQADIMGQWIDDSVLAIASKMTPTQRETKFNDMVANRTKRCISTSIYAQGVTFPDIRVIINAAGGGGAITSTQKPGRLAQVRPGKKCGYMIDFLFEPILPTEQAHDPESRRRAYDAAWGAVVIDSKNRLRKYQSNGYQIQIVKNIEEIEVE